MAKYEKNRSTRRSTPRHPIAMASTAKPPDPMPCALAAILLPESLAPACHMRKTLFPGQVAYKGPGVIRVRAGIQSRGCGVDARREPGHQHGCGEAVPGDAGGRRALVGSPVAATQTRVGVGWASAWGAGRRGVFPQCGVEHAWALGLVGRLVALSGLLRRSPSGPLRDC